MIESVLATTIASLLAHRHDDSHIVIVGHGARPDCYSNATRLHWLDISRSPAFGADRSPVEVDKGLKYLIGLLFAERCLEPADVMLMDADDYVNVDLASLLAPIDIGDRDGFLIHSGVHVTVSVAPGEGVRFGPAFLVRDFDRSCGSCRVFRAAALRAHYLSLHPEGRLLFQEEAASTGFRSGISRQALAAFIEAVGWGGPKAYSLVHVLGRHLAQETHFRFQPCPVVGAAKGCGHGNHDGPRHGEIHREKVLADMPIEEFRRTFGLGAFELC